MAPDASYSQAIEPAKKYDIADLIKDVKDKIFEHSHFGLRSLTKVFNAIDKNGNKQLDCDELICGLGEFGISVSREEGEQVLNYFDANHNGTIDFSEFLRALRVSIQFSFNNLFFKNIGWRS